MPVPRLSVPAATVTAGDAPKPVALLRLTVPALTTNCVPVDKPGDAAPTARVPVPVFVSVRTVPPSLSAPVVIVAPVPTLIVGLPVIVTGPTVRAAPEIVSVFVPIETPPSVA